MGFYDKSQVPPMLLIDNPDIDPEMLSKVGVTVQGTPRIVDIDDIIAAEGERVPDASESHKNFKSAFIFITRPGTFTSTELHGIEYIREEWITRFAILTDGAGLMEVTPSLKEDIPTNPGISLLPFDPRTLPPNIDDGLQWLMNHQGPDGSWMDMSQTVQRDTVETLLALRHFDIAQQNLSSGIQWLEWRDSKNMVYLSKKIEALVEAGEDVTLFIEKLISGQNLDGGWGSDKDFTSNPIDTSFAL